MDRATRRLHLSRLPPIHVATPPGVSAKKGIHDLAADSKAVDQAANALQKGEKAVILIRGSALKERGLKLAGRISAKTGARIACDYLAPHIQRGAGRVVVERIPYWAEDIAEFSAGGRTSHPSGGKAPNNLLCISRQNKLADT